MKKFFAMPLLTVMLFGLSLAARAQTQEEPKADRRRAQRRRTAVNVVIDEGVQARLSLQTQLSSKLIEVGDQVTRSALRAHPLKRRSDRIPRGTEFFGRVTQVQPAKRPQKEATMTIVFETMRMSYGTEKVATVCHSYRRFRER
jgi:hypothetical protein